jgi:hypothetical protein
MQSSIAAVTCPACQTRFLSGESTCRVCGKRRGFAPRKFSVTSLTLRTAGIALLFAICAAIGLFSYSNFRLVRCYAYQDSLRIVSSSSEMQNAIGSGIHLKFPPSAT